MQEVMAYARQLEDEPVLKTNVFYGFAKADTPSTGVSVVSVTDGSQERAEHAARDLAGHIWHNRERLNPDFPSSDEAVQQAREIVSGQPLDAGPVMLCDVGDDVAAGTAGDGTPLLRALLEQKVENAGFAILRDPEVVSEAVQSGVGSAFLTTLGGKTDNLHGEPIEDVEVYVKAITDGVFVNQGPVGTGQTVKMDQTVHLECGPNREVSVIATQSPGVPLDAEVWRHIGIQPERRSILAIKSEIFYGEDDDHFAGDVLFVDTPGLWSMDHSQFEYSYLQDPIYPIDDLPDDAYNMEL
jgi:microcystin degradation protein MlrC